MSVHLKPSIGIDSEPWPPSLTRLWALATAPEQRRALQYRMSLRCAVNPNNLPVPADELLQGIRGLELIYRSRSACRGGRQSWE